LTQLLGIYIASMGINTKFNLYILTDLHVYNSNSIIPIQNVTVAFCSSALLVEIKSSFGTRVDYNIIHCIRIMSLSSFMANFHSE
jgi:hypothetical protein